MSWSKTFRLGLAAKVAVCVIASTAAFFTLFGYINLRMERSHSEHLVQQAAERVSDLILRSTRYAMLNDDRAALSNIIQEFGAQPGIRRIRVFNSEGRITLSTDAKEINLNAAGGPGVSRIFTDEHGNRVLSVVRNIENLQQCTACHVHPASKRVLGVIDADLSLAEVDAQMRVHQ